MDPATVNSERDIYIRKLQGVQILKIEDLEFFYTIDFGWLCIPISIAKQTLLDTMELYTREFILKIRVKRIAALKISADQYTIEYMQLYALLLNKEHCK